MSSNPYAFTDPGSSPNGIVEGYVDVTPGEVDPVFMDYVSEIEDTDATSGDAPVLPDTGAIPRELLYDLHRFLTRRVMPSPRLTSRSLSLQVPPTGQPFLLLGEDRTRDSVYIFTDLNNPGSINIGTDRNSLVSLAPGSVPIELPGFQELWASCTSAGVVYAITKNWYEYPEGE